MDREALWATVHGVAKESTQLNDRAHSHVYNTSDLRTADFLPWELLAANSRR